MDKAAGVVKELSIVDAVLLSMYRSVIEDVERAAGVFVVPVVIEVSKLVSDVMSTSVNELKADLDVKAGKLDVKVSTSNVVGVNDTELPELSWASYVEDSYDVV